MEITPIKPDVQLAELVLLYHITNRGLTRIKLSRVAVAVKVTDLRQWHPGIRELSSKDPFHKINPWMESLFIDHFAYLKRQGYIDYHWENGESWVSLTPEGCDLARKLIKDPPYSQFVKQFIDAMRKARGSWRILISMAKWLLRDQEKCIFSVKSKSRIKATAHGPEVDDVAEMARGIWKWADLNRAIKPPSSGQRIFHQQMKRQSQCPVATRKKYELCGLCTEMKTGHTLNSTLISLEVEGEIVTVEARGFPDLTGYEHHSMRVIGYAGEPGSSIDFIALRGYDRGYYFS